MMPLLLDGICHNPGSSLLSCRLLVLWAETANPDGPAEPLAARRAEQVWGQGCLNCHDL